MKGPPYLQHVTMHGPACPSAQKARSARFVAARLFSLMQHEPGALQNPTMLLTFIQQYNGKPKGRQHEASAREICSFGLPCGLFPIDTVGYSMGFWQASLTAHACLQRVWIWRSAARKMRLEGGTQCEATSSSSSIAAATDLPNRQSTRHSNGQWAMIENTDTQYVVHNIGKTFAWGVSGVPKTYHRQVLQGGFCEVVLQSGSAGRVLWVGSLGDGLAPVHGPWAPSTTPAGRRFSLQDAG